MLGFIAWVLIIWASIQILSSFATPVLIGRPRPVYTATTAAVVMFINISVGVAILTIAISSLNGASA